MTKIFIEAEDKTTPEYNFLKASVSLHFPTKQVDFTCIGGIGNLFNETNKNQISQTQEVGEQVLILIDAESEDSMQQDLQMRMNGIKNLVTTLFNIFLSPKFCRQEYV